LEQEIILHRKREHLYSILDIETTGGKYNEEGITEIAIYKFNGHKIVDQFISLINPERPIQDFVAKLTGINNQMLRNAPKFYEVAKRIVEITENTIIVAHNATFDYRILKTEFDRLGYNYNKNSLCTVELSRELIPNQPSYSLGKLCKALGIPMSDRHRANGDALATVQLFKLLLEKDTVKNILQESVKYYDKREEKDKLNKILDTLPEDRGVFYMHDTNGKVVYIGKGKNIKAEVNKVFLKDTKRSLKIKDRISKISFENTGNILITRLKYYLELDELKPKYNFKKRLKINLEPFKHDNFIIYLKGRIPEENSIILVENNSVFGYGFTNLSFQENQIEILKPNLTPIHNQQLAKTIIRNYLKTNTPEKIVRF